jgi:hypothetical protein
MTIASKPSANLFNRVRAAFMERGSSLNAWCTDHGITYSWARQCLLGIRNGEAARRMVEKITREVDLSP